MCFSPEASFSTSAVLLITGIIAVREAKFTYKFPFAIIPLFFSVQQLSEGILWLSMQGSGFEYLKQPSTFIFLIFAQVVWPFWVPFSIFLLEKNKSRRQWLRGLTIMGIVLSTYTLYRMIKYPVIASIDCRHIIYSLDFPQSFSWVVTVIYLIATIIPPFISTARRTNLLGIVIVISLIASELFYTQALISVWCFFASILSVIIIYVLREMRIKIEPIPHFM